MPEGLRVRAPGLSTTLQDLGRPGFLRFGVSGSGAMDPDALVLANALVGNSASTAALEVAMLGPTLACEIAACRVAVAGASFRLRINGRPVDAFTAHDLVRNDELAIEASSDGVWAYLAVAGGFAVPPQLGSLSTHTRSRLGGLTGDALTAGDLLPLAGEAPSGSLLTLPEHLRKQTGGTIRVVLGPQADYFTQVGIETFLSQPYTVSARADRMAFQVDGPPVAQRDGFNIVSDGIVAGSIQVSGDGRPLILLADRQTTGGYPKIATVISADLGRLAQTRPGDIICFEAIDVDGAQAAARATRINLAYRLKSLLGTTQSDFSSGFLLSCNLISGVVSGNSDD